MYLQKRMSKRATERASMEEEEKEDVNGRMYRIQRTIRHRYVLAGAVKIKAFLHLADMSLCANTPSLIGIRHSMPMRFDSEQIVQHDWT